MWGFRALGCRGFGFTGVGFYTSWKAGHLLCIILIMTVAMTVTSSSTGTTTITNTISTSNC